jgi:hypothetical protein
MKVQGRLACSAYAVTASVLAIAVVLTFPAIEAGAQTTGSPKRPPQISILPGSHATSGVHRIVASPEQIQQGEMSEIASPEQKALWKALIALMRSDQGYHTPEQIGKALGVKMVLVQSTANSRDSSVWKAQLPGAHAILIERGNNSVNSILSNSQLSIITVGWDAASTRPHCISSLKLLAQLQLSGAVGFQRDDQTRDFLFPLNEQASFSSADLTDQTCVSKFSLVGHARPKDATP